MSVASPTVLPRPPLFPRLLPKIQRPHPAPLPPQSRTYGHLKAARNLQREMDDLSDEENEIEEMVRPLSSFFRGWLSSVRGPRRTSSSSTADSPRWCP